MPKTMSLEDYEELSQDHGGRCKACNEDAYGVEPDARNYVCEDCGQPEVFGCDEWLMEGLVG